MIDRVARDKMAEINTQVELAPEYTKSEKLRFIVIEVIAGVVIIAVGKLLFSPWLAEFAKSADCHTYLGVSGGAWLMYGVFVGLPALCAILVTILCGPRGYKTLRQGQMPPIGQKVFRPTPIRRGAKARVMGALQLVFVALTFAFVIWGVIQAQTFATGITSSKNCTSVTNASIPSN